MDLKTFMERYGRDLFQAAEEHFPPLVEAPKPLRFPGGRKPLGAQALAITGVAEALKREPAAFLVAEMGTGKTFMAIRALLEWKPKGRFLVLCPPQLTEKWREEVEMEGVRAVVLRSPKDVAALKGMEGPLFAVLSREKAKLGPGWRHAHASRRTKEGRVPACPRCGAVVEIKESHRNVCKDCGEPLWQEKPPRRESLYHALKRLLPKGFFQGLVLDEAHEYKGGDTAQGAVAAGLSSWIGKTLLLTGTLFGGYASSLYHLLRRTVPEVREKFKTLTDFVAQYGLYEYITKTREESGYGYYARRRKENTRTRERPGLSPLLLTHLLPRAAFLRLSDVAQDLPPYGEEVHLLPMDPEHERVYSRFLSGLSAAARQALDQGSMRLLATLVQARIQTPDYTWEEEVVMDEGKPVARLHPLGEGLHAKERFLVELVREEKARGRKVLVYVQGTERRDQIARLTQILEEAGLRAAGLRADTVSPEERMAWIRAQGEVDALVLHPRLVQTGLDLLDFPTIVWYQPDYSVYTVRQASRRSWRIGQKRPVRVVFLAYKGTLQEAALGLMAEKAQSSLALEGELVEGGLVSLASESPVMALAKALVGERVYQVKAFTLEKEARPYELEPVTVGAPAPERLTQKPEPSRSPAPPIELPTLREGRWVGRGRNRWYAPPGQPVLFDLEAMGP